MIHNKSFGAFESPIEEETVIHPTKATVPAVRGGTQYGPEDVDDQSQVGICTADSFAQNASKTLGYKVSADFQYLLQKKYVDGNWDEGSSILSALKVGVRYGMLPASAWTFTTQADRDAGYAVYVAKLQAITNVQIDGLLALCNDKLTGYGQVTDLSTNGLANAILDSKVGILCRYSVGPEWYTAPDGTITWNAAYIDPIRPPTAADVIDGHAINCNYFDFEANPDEFIHANTWGIDWDLVGDCHIVNSEYPPTEAWIPYYGTVGPVTPPAYKFTTNPVFGSTSNDVKELQTLLKMPTKYQTGYFGMITLIAVVGFQIKNHLPITDIVSDQMIELLQ